GRFLDGLNYRRMRVTGDQRSPRGHVVDVFVAIDVTDASTTRAVNKPRRTANRPEGTHRAVDTTRQQLLCAFEQLPRALQSVCLLNRVLLAHRTHFLLSSMPYFTCPPATGGDVLRTLGESYPCWTVWGRFVRSVRCPALVCRQGVVDRDRFVVQP